MADAKAGADAPPDRSIFDSGTTPGLAPGSVATIFAFNSEPESVWPSRGAANRRKPPVPEARGDLVVFTCSFYGSVDDVRFKCCLDMLHVAKHNGVRVVVVDASPSDAVRRCGGALDQQAHDVLPPRCQLGLGVHIQPAARLRVLCLVASAAPW